MGTIKKIVVAEDDSGIRDAFLLTLTRAGYQVALYADGEPLMTHPFEVPDLFIIDRQLSGVDGLDVCQHLKQSPATVNIPVIITSASPYVAGLASRMGADAFLEKPFGTKQLVALVTRLLADPRNAQPGRG
jgi:DNA-binding response OmpR family regulator